VFARPLWCGYNQAVWRIYDDIVMTHSFKYEAQLQLSSLARTAYSNSGEGEQHSKLPPRARL
jgi:hypothetical protein